MLRYRIPLLIVISFCMLLALFSAPQISSKQLYFAQDHDFSLNNETCLQVVDINKGENLYLPLITDGFSSRNIDSQTSRLPLIQSVTENSGGCLKFVGEEIHFVLVANELGGEASIDIGDVHTGLRLYDDGTHGDSIANDGIYELAYVLTTQDIVRNAYLTAHFASSSGSAATPVKSATNLSVTDFNLDLSSVASSERIEVEPESDLFFAPDRLILEFSQVSTSEEIVNFFIANDLTLSSWIPDLKIYEVEIAYGQDLEAIAQELSSSSLVINAGKSYFFEAAVDSTVVPDQKMITMQMSHLNPIRAKLGWSHFTQGEASIIVGVIDSGINNEHEELQNQVISQYRPLAGTFGDSCRSNDGHGTPVAGIIVAENGNGDISGVAPNVKLIDFKLNVIMFGTRCLFNTMTVAAHINDAIRDDVRVLSMSFGDNQPYSDLPRIGIPQAIRKAADNNIVLVAASGNHGSGICFENLNESECPYEEYQYPASYEDVLAVGSTDYLADTLAEDSNFGTDVVYAPGVGVYTTSKNESSYAGVRGTSFAAPQVAALAALILSVNPDLSAPRVIEIIKNTADDTIRRLNPNTMELEEAPGHGRINVYRALSVAVNNNDLDDPGEDPLPLEVEDVNYAYVLGEDGPYLEVNWTPPSTDYAGVHIYRHMRSLPESHSSTDEMTLIDGGTFTETSFQDRSIEYGRLYSYYIFSVDPTGQESLKYGIDSPDQAFSPQMQAALRQIKLTQQDEYPFFMPVPANNSIYSGTQVTLTWNITGDLGGGRLFCMMFI